MVRLRRGADRARDARRAARRRSRTTCWCSRATTTSQREQRYWDTNTPIGYVFTFGVIMGFVVGAIIVYQILFADVSDHLAEYATLKAMGYPNRYLFGVVFQEAVILAVLGFIPGLLICDRPLPRRRRRDPAADADDRADWPVFVLALAIVMCCVSGAIALRKIRSADPAEIF